MALKANPISAFAVFSPLVADLTLAHPGTGEPTDIVLQLIGPECAEYRAKHRELQQKNILKSKKENTDPTLAEFDAQNIELMATCVKGWDAQHFDGKPCTAANVIEVLTNLVPLREQVARFLEDRKNFFR